MFTTVIHVHRRDVPTCAVRSNFGAVSQTNVGAAHGKRSRPRKYSVGAAHGKRSRPRKYSVGTAHGKRSRPRKEGSS